MIHSPVTNGTSGRTALVADDHEVFRTALARILRDDCGFTSVVEAANHDDSFRCLDDPSPTLATFDLRMPGAHGFLEIQAIRRLYPDLRVVIVTASERRQDVLDAMAAGVHGYVPKTLGRAGIAAAFEVVSRGQVFVPWFVTDLSRKGGDEQADDGGAANHPALTARQADVLRLIRAGQTNKEIARNLSLAESTVKVHANAIYKVLGVRNRVGAAALLSA